MNTKDTFKTMVGAYYGVLEMDEYPLKEYVLYDLKNYIINFVREQEVVDFSFIEVAEDVEKYVSLKTKLQDCLIILPKIKVSMELLFLIKRRIQDFQE